MLAWDWFDALCYFVRRLTPPEKGPSLTRVTTIYFVPTVVGVGKAEQTGEVHSVCTAVSQSVSAAFCFQYRKVWT